MTSSLPGVQLYVEDSSGGLVPVTEVMLQGNGTTTPINITGATVTEYPSLAALLAEAPDADEIGYVAQSATDGNKGKAYVWDLTTGTWTIITAVSSVNSKTGVVTLTPDDIAESATRKWLTVDERQRIFDTSNNVLSLQTSQSAQDTRLNAIESLNTTQQDAISQLQNDVGNLGINDLNNRLNTAETNITAIQSVNTTQSGAIALLQSGQSTQDAQIAAIQSVNTTQSGQITALQTADAGILVRLTTVENGQTTQDATAAAIAARVTTAEGKIGTLETSQATQDITTNALTSRVTTAEGDIVALESGQVAIQSTITTLPSTYQVRSEKNQAGGYVGLRPDGTINPNQLPPSIKTVREISYVATIAARDALAANDPRPEVNGPWGATQAGYAVSVADKGDGSAGFYVWNGAGFDDYSSAFTLTNSDDVPEGSTNLYYTNNRVANAPAVTGLVVAVSDLEDRMDNAELDLNAVEAVNATQTANIATNAGNIATNTGDISALGVRMGTAENEIDAVEAVNATQTANIATNASNIAALQSENAAQATAINARLTSFNGRTAPAVIPTAGDYAASMLTNDSGEPGATVADALTGHGAEIDALAALIGPVANKVTKGGDADAAPLVIGTNDAQSLTMETNNTPRIVVGASGEVTINGLTENALGSHYVKQDPVTKRIYATPVVEAQLVDVSEIPLTTWVSATTVQVGVGAVVCRSIVDSNSKRLWNRPINIAPITAVLPAGLSASQTVYLFAATNGTGDSASDTAFFSTTNPPNNTPTGFNWVRHIASFVLNSSAQLNPFLMDGERWVTGNFASESFIAGASWASKVIPGCPLGSVEVYGIVSPGLPPSGTYAIRITTANPTTAAIAAPSTVEMLQSGFDANLSNYHNSPTAIAATASFSGVAESGLLWHYKTGAAYLNADYYPTVRLLKYRTVLKVLS